MISIGLDISLTGTGIAPIAGDPFTLNTPADKISGHERYDLVLRHVDICMAAANHRDRYDRLLVAIEGYAFSKGSQKGARDVAELTGIVKHHLWTNGVEFVIIPPNTLKAYATGNGQAGKPKMMSEALKFLGVPASADDNACDAAWLRAAVRHRYGSSPHERFPEGRRAKLDSVPWPKDRS